MTRNKWVKPALLGVALLTMFACRHHNWKDIPSLELGTKTLNAGKQVRLEPSLSNPVQMPGSQLSSEKFKFQGTLLDTRSDLDVKKTVTVGFISGDKLRAVTMTGEPMKWMKNERRREIEISFFVPPGEAFGSEQTLSGRGFLYFYLTGPDGSCVSNIIAWPMEFK
ncbi:MAG: hypothetical protein LAO04_14835 [Acidobacteriia bacterium]|nr:hypothetical protein [Terriglobia bacterium]